jgi:hypothetical protein
MPQCAPSAGKTLATRAIFLWWTHFIAMIVMVEVPRN